MTDTEYEHLQAKADQLWDEFQALELPYNIKRQEWSDTYIALKREKMKREIIAEQESCVSLAN